MLASKRALEVTNPGASYVVLTDRATAPHLERDFELAVLAPSGWPLMRQYVEAQRLYEANAAPGLVVLAATDCVASRSLHDSLQHNMAITYRPRGRHLVNNIAYIYDHDRASWFLERALGLMKPNHYEYWGDQESWQDALGPYENWHLIEPLSDNGIRKVSVDGHWIHLYPCHTHNYFSKRSGAASPTARRAYIWHFKGPRKNVMVQAISEHLLGREQLVNTPVDVYPMQERIGKKERGNADSAVGVLGVLGNETGTGADG